MIVSKKYYIETILQKKSSIRKISRVVQTFCYGKKGNNYLYQVLVLDLDFLDIENSLDNITKTIALLFDELELEITPQNKITKVINLSFIKRRWESTKMEILAENEGYELLSYCESISQMLEKEEEIIAFLHQNKMLGMIFNGYTVSNANFSFDNFGNSQGILEEITDNEHIKYALLCLV